MDNKFLLRKSTGDQPIATEADLLGSLQRGQCKASDFVYDFNAKAWGRVGDHPSVAVLFAEKPAQVPERRVIYYLQPGGAAAMPQGPFSTKEIQARAQQRELCSSSWVFVEGDKEWRQVRAVKILNDMLPPLPVDAPAASAASAPAAEPDSPPTPSITFASAPAGSLPPSAPPKPERQTNPSISIDLGMSDAPPPAPPPAAAADSEADPYVEKEESTLALDIMGLNLHSEHATAAAPEPLTKPAKPGLAPIPAAAPPPSVPPSAPPPKPAVAKAPPPSPKAPPAAPPKAPPAAAATLSIETPPGGTKKPPAANPNDSFDGIVAEIPTDPVWLVKQGNSETVNGPFRFLEIVKFLEEGKLTKNDKISRVGTKSFVKIQQQYEFNVKFSVETVVENGQEKQKILIRRRHPRVPYITGVQIVSKHGLLAGNCVNISAGGILMEVPKADFNLGEIIEVKILPGLIAKSISCKSLIIGKIPKAPPGYALKFEDLKPDDKEAIEYYVQETLKREMSKKH